MEEVLYNLDISMNYENPYDQARNIEWNNKVVYEQFRIAYYKLPIRKYQG